ncbi:hypothetical protein MTER_00250 [Mycolicibacter terrae]|uniref:AMP-dependent synthetase/ligase domain-containing protein n=1 Tax=Mycolicibacter terrae TaxID=1788 RepID=A0AAD1HTX2_9MYCO|nr:AMP-binding protein [Mycolicibacter terrae]BBX20614.1 hypothetical protein MTER_00250 [Mycolicibacter terrae]
MAEPTTSATPTVPDTLVDLMRQQAARHQDTPAFIFCPDGDVEQDRITYRELDRRARSIAVNLQRQGAAGERVLVLCRPGVDSVAGLFGCFYAGAVAVPVDEHWPIRRIETVVPEARPFRPGDGQDTVQDEGRRGRPGRRNRLALAGDGRGLRRRGGLGAPGRR